jgi:hypothetical protein
MTGIIETTDRRSGLNTAIVIGLAYCTVRGRADRLARAHSTARVCRWAHHRVSDRALLTHQIADRVG